MSESAASPAPAVRPVSPAPRDRFAAVDLLRGIVMVLMALDHTRDFLHFGAVHGVNPLDYQTTTIPLFLTRWITHFCAPTFIFLAGTGAFLSGTRGRSPRELSWFLVTRGLWLILLELTFIHWAGWSFTVDLHVNYAIVIWAIGWSMIVLAGLIHLPRWAIATVALGMILGHNALDAVKPESWGAFAWLWQVLHAGGKIEVVSGYFLLAGYPLIPWIGVMAAGYCFGSILVGDPVARRRLVFRIGAILTVGFIALRASNLYGNPTPWLAQARPGFTALAFLDCHKYPPSLCYLLMTLGPALMLLAALDRPVAAATRPLLVFGRVPLFYYLLHLPVIHGLCVVLESLRHGSAPWLFGDPFGPTAAPAANPNAGLGLPAVYLMWITALLLLYPACAWFAALKRRRQDAWLSYL